ncbi:ribonuclease III domain-containing protein [Gelria sp. Kuro-4]|uniref:ribonuclease III domain-containing protein n=1 Tax=Gelria sp. Kuro-4 TaxID=2796927 RepID=UPI001BEFDE40|nr:ribonuclease III domain-containing protein [Gelria sp. Kuro-4]MDI3522775.1 mini-ribonuclease [Bacillota bacterium]MDK2928252.1 mini-ribonuclease [Bacillota bacterium]BCV23342.1 mini-ribonuclease 3 [Gelria sp. Kuro-4]
MSELPSSLALAYLGDAVLELYVRHRLVTAGPAPVRDLHRATAARVSAVAQAAVWDKLAPELTAEEAAVARRARNAHPAHAPRGARPEHHLSTALEAVLGYLYLLLTGSGINFPKFFSQLRRRTNQPRIRR